MHEKWLGQKSAEKEADTQMSAQKPWIGIHKSHFCCIVLAGMYGGAAAEEAAVWGPEASFSPSLAQFMAAWGVAPGPVFLSSSGRWASPRRAVHSSTPPRVLCAYVCLGRHFGCAHAPLILLV